MGANVEMVTTPDSQPASRAAGSDPGATAIPCSAYCSVSMTAARDRPIRPSSQPMALPGTRVAISRPVPAYRMAVSAATA
jgi:hypothetical protein